MSQATESSQWRGRIGIIGGLGPHAHLEMERRLLAAVGPVTGDQGYPSWIVVSIPETPDRTAYLLGDGPSPVPDLIDGARRLEAAGADFGLIACNTAHVFLDDIRAQTRLPMLDMVQETLAAAGCLGWTRIGLLATTGTLRTELYPRAAARTDSEIEVISLLDLIDGARHQDELVMRSIYGSTWEDGDHSGGIKAGLTHDPQSGKPYADALHEALALVAAEGVDGVILGCTELPLALGRGTVGSIETLDPVDVVAREAVRIAGGNRELPNKPS